MERVYGEGEIRVNSMHHMAVDEVAPGFSATARCPDGVIEAIESTMADWFAMGTQFHPEADSASALTCGSLKNSCWASPAGSSRSGWSPERLGRQIALAVPQFGGGGCESGMDPCLVGWPGRPGGGGYLPVQVPGWPTGMEPDLREESSSFVEFTTAACACRKPTGGT